MARNLLILGAGQYGMLAREIAVSMGCFDQIAFLDDNSSIAIGKFQDSYRFLSQYSCAFVALGNSELRLTCIKRLTEEGFELPILRHPSAVVMPSADIAPGCILEPMTVVSSHCTIGTGCLISAGAVVNHNAVLGIACQVDCNATVPARCVLPEHTKVACGEVFRPLAD